MRRAALIAVLILASCSGDGQATESIAPAPTTTTAEPPTTTTSAPETTNAPTTATSTTTTTTLPPNAAPEFVLSQVVFGDSSFVVITNWGTAPGTLKGLWLSQETSYQALPDVALAPAEQALIGLAAKAPPDLAGMAATIDLGPAVGDVVAESGELGLHSGSAFDDGAALLAYVAWGDGPHLRVELATSVGLWDGTAVPVVDEAPSISTGVYPAVRSIDWSADIGG